MAGYHIQVGFVVTYGITTYQDRCCSQLWYDDISRCNAHFECVCLFFEMSVQPQNLQDNTYVLLGQKRKKKK
jgi:hypothetical protein